MSPEGKTIRFDSQAHFMDEARLKARMSTEVEVEREVEKREAVEGATNVAPSAGTATPATSEAATVPPEAMSATSSAAEAASGSPSADAADTSEPALVPDAIEPAEEVTTTAILPHIEQPPHKPSLLVRALAAAIRFSNRRK